MSDSIQLTVEPHSLLQCRAFVTEFPSPLGKMETPPSVIGLHAVNANAPLQRDEEVRKDVRDLLRVGGYKPTGRGKPASEYLVKAASEGFLGPINLAVDVCNAVSLHSGLPISVIDLDVAKPPLRIAVAEPGSSYVFNQGGQEIDIGGLLCVFDQEGPCANAVKDSQRTKTSEATVRTFSVVWASNPTAGRLERAMEWYREMLEGAGAVVTEVEAG